MSKDLQQQMWRAFHQEDLEAFKRALQDGADPDDRERVLSDKPRDTIIGAMLSYKISPEDRWLNAQMAELCFLYGSDIDFNRKHTSSLGYFLHAESPEFVSVILSEMAARDIERNNKFELPIDSTLGGIGPSFPDAEKDISRERAADSIRHNQHTFVDYVRTAQTPAAVFLRSISDHPSASIWTEKMELPDHTKYSRPHPDFVRAVENLGRVSHAMSKVCDGIIRRDPGSQAEARYVWDEVDEARRFVDECQQSWKPQFPN